jgi:nitrate reductase cytochrome c-type subunit
MNYPILTAVLIAVMLTACKGEGKPGQYPPSLYQEREGTLSDAELEKNKKQAAEAAEKVYPADDPAVPHAESDEELAEKNVEATDSTEDSETPKAKSE